MGVIGIIGMILGLQVKASWQPMTNLLPPDFVKTAQFLLAHGMADPRGCELRNVQHDFYVPAEWLSIGGYQVAWVRSDTTKVITQYGIAVSAKSVGTIASTSRFLPRFQRDQNNQPLDIQFLDDDKILGLILAAVHGEEEIVEIGRAHV